jgi:multidrug efflux pump
MVVKSGGDGSIVRLGDVATVELGAQNYDARSLSSGRAAVSIAIAPTPDGNPLEIVAGVKALLPQIQRVAPPGLKVISQFDTAHFVEASIDEVEHTLIEAVAIVIVVIFLFLGTFAR